MRDKPQVYDESLQGHFVGYYIEGGVLYEVEGEKEAIEEADGRQVYWDRDKATEALFRINEPVEAAFRDLKEGLISQLDFQHAVGEIAARKRLEQES